MVVPLTPLCLHLNTHDTAAPCTQATPHKRCHSRHNTYHLLFECCCVPRCCRASKAALNIINKAMAMDLAGDDIRCVLVHPGYVQTDMTGGNLGNGSRVDVQTNVVVLESMGEGD